MIVFDPTTLSAIWVPGAAVNNRKTNKPIKHAAERIELLIETIAANEDVIIIPAPVLSEIIVKIPGKADELLKKIKSSPWFKVEGFDAAAAVALVTGASEIISDDSDIAAIGERWGVTVRSIDDLPVPPELIPPPLLASLEDEEVDESKKQPLAAESSAPDMRGGGDGHPGDQTGAGDAKITEEGGERNRPPEGQ